MKIEIRVRDIIIYIFIIALFVFTFLSHMQLRAKLEIKTAIQQINLNSQNIQAIVKVLQSKGLIQSTPESIDAKK